MVLGWGIVQLGMSVQSHDASQRTQGILLRLWRPYYCFCEGDFVRHRRGVTGKRAGRMERPAPLLMEAAMRKYNKIISCTRTENGAWRLLVQTPNDQFHSRIYIG